MIFIRYFLSRFLLVFIGVTFTLAFIFNLFEFFEKLVRVAHAGVGVTLKFAILHFLPSCSELMPATSWLTSCLVIREMSVRGEWEALQLLGVTNRQLGRLFLISGTLLCIGALGIHEHLIVPLHTLAERFRLEQFKHGVSSSLFNRWIMLDENEFCFIGSLDMRTQEGNRFLITRLVNEGAIEEIISADYFKLDIRNKTIVLGNGRKYQMNGRDKQYPAHYAVPLSRLFSQIGLILEEPTVYSLFHHILSPQGVPSDVYVKIREKLVARALFYAQIAFLPFLVYFIFSLLQAFLIGRWVGMVLIYPTANIFVLIVQWFLGNH